MPMQRHIRECSLPFFFFFQIGQKLEINPNVLQQLNATINNGGGGEIKKKKKKQLTPSET